MSDAENEVPEEDAPEEGEEPTGDEPPAPPPKPMSKSAENGSTSSLPEKKVFKQREGATKPPHYSGGKPSKFDKEKLMQSEGIIRIQSGTNKYATQAGQTGFGVPRDVVDKVKSENLKPLEDEEKIRLLKGVTWLQSGTNKFASQKGQTGFGSPRDVLYKPKGSGGASEVEEAKARATDGIIPLQYGTNKLASQAGMTGIGTPRIINTRNNPDQTRDSQGFIHLQMGTNRFATQAGMTGMGMPRHNLSKYKDEARGEIPHDESSVSRQTSGWKEGDSQQGMTAFSAFRRQTQALKNQDRRSQGLIPYQMGINWGDSQQGKTGFGMPRQVFTSYVDDNSESLPEDIARAPEVPFWSGMEQDFANQAGMTGMGMPRDVKGLYVRRLW